MSDMQFGKIITSETFYDGVITNTRTEFELSIMSTRETLIKDIFENIGLVTSGETSKLTLEFYGDPRNPDKFRIIKRWCV